MEKLYVVIMNKDGTGWPLELYPNTQAQCTRAIQWQRMGPAQFSEMLICTYSTEHKKFIPVDENSARQIEPNRMPYTKEVFAAAMERNFA